MNWAFTYEAPTARLCTRLCYTLLLLPGTLTAQHLPPSAVVKKSVNLIQVPVVVRDRKGHAVTNLNVDDFAIYDNGTLQKIAQFRCLRARDSEYASDRRVPRQEIARTNGSSSDGASSPPNGEEPEDPHLLIVIPQLQFSSRFYALGALAKALQQRSLDNETISIIDNSSQVLAFTRDRDSLMQAVKQLQSVKMSPCQGGPWIAAARDRLLQMRSMPGRKFLLIFTDAEPDPQCVTLGEFGFGNSPWALLRLALDSNVAIYPVDPRGVVPVVPGGDASTQAYFGPDATARVSGAINGRLSGELSALAAEQRSFMQVAARTGGRAPTGNALSRAFRMMREDSSYYELAYYLPDLQADGAYHRIGVRLRRSDLQVLTKEGYQAPIPFAGLSRSQKREWLYHALLKDQPLGEIELATRSSAFFNPPSADATIHLAVQARWWVPESERHDRRWTMLVCVVQDEHGTVVGYFENTNFWHANDNPREASGYLKQDAAYNVLTRLKPGRYQLKLAIADLYTAIAGSRRLFFLVPEQVSPQPFASSVVLAEQWVPDVEGGRENADTNENPAREINRIASNGVPDPLRIDDRRLVPSLDRVFAQDAQLSVFVRFYPTSEDHWKVSASLRDSAGNLVIRDAPANVLSPTPGISGIPILYTFNLSKLRLRDGKYSAELEFVSDEHKQPLRVGGLFIINTAGQ
jgi:VWFA-related protein